MDHLTLKQILEAEDLKEEVVEVPEWGEPGTVLVHELTAQQKINMGLQANDGDWGPLFVMAAAYGLGIEDPKQIEALGRKNFDPVQRVARAVMRLSGMKAPDEGEEAEAEPKKT